MVGGLKKLEKRRIGLLFICFYMIWIIKELVFSHYPELTVALILSKIVVWILPVYMYLKYVDQVLDPFSFLKLKKNILKGVSTGLAIGLVMIFIEAMLIYAFHGKTNLRIGIRWVTTLIYAFPEEVLFRGFIFQKIAKSVRFMEANLYTSLLFVSIHFPAWFIQGVTIPKLIFNILVVFAVEFGLGYIFKKTNSLWSSTIVHTVYNLLMYIRA